MKVDRCSATQAKKDEPKFLSVEEMKKNEGVYKVLSKNGADSYKEWRAIVVGGDGNPKQVFVYNSQNNLIDTMFKEEHWNTSHVFEKTDETICFELKKA